MTDTLFINDITIRCILGISEAERSQKQPVIINIALSLDTSKAAKTDAITDTVNYHDLCVSIVGLVASSSFYLLETLAQSIATLCLKDTRIKQVKVHVEKPNALKGLARSSGIEIIRKNE